MTILTIIADVGCLNLVRGLKKRTCPNKKEQVSTCQEKHILNEIPMRSTILNFGIICIWSLTVPVGILNYFDKVDKANIGKFIN